jgi:hypothetical protein
MLILSMLFGAFEHQGPTTGFLLRHAFYRHGYIVGLAARPVKYQTQLHINQPCGVSHPPDFAARKTASITAMFLIASVSGTGTGLPSRTAFEKTSP